MDVTSGIIDKWEVHECMKMNYRNGWKTLNKCGPYLVVFMSLSVSLTSAFLPNEFNEIDVPFTALDSTHSNRKGKCEYRSCTDFRSVSRMDFSFLLSIQMKKKFCCFSQIQLTTFLIHSLTFCYGTVNWRVMTNSIARFYCFRNILFVSIVSSNQINPFKLKRICFWIHEWKVLLNCSNFLSLDRQKWAQTTEN